MERVDVGLDAGERVCVAANSSEERYRSTRKKCSANILSLVFLFDNSFCQAVVGM